jgi:hypothetical protein
MRSRAIANAATPSSRTAHHIERRMAHLIDPIDKLDRWLRGEFVRINTALEELYFAERIDVIRGRPAVDALKRELLQQGGPLMERLAAMPALPDHPHASYRLRTARPDLGAAV